MEERRLQKAVRLIPIRGHCWQREVHWIGGSSWEPRSLNLCSSWKGLRSQEEITSLILYPNTIIGVKKCTCPLYLVQNNKANLSCGAHQRRPSEAKQGHLDFQKARIQGLLTRLSNSWPDFTECIYLWRSFRTVSLKNSTYFGISWDAC